MTPSTKRRRTADGLSHTWPLGALGELVNFFSLSSTHVHLDVAHTSSSAPYLTLRNDNPGLSPALLLALVSPISPPPCQHAALRLADAFALLSVPAPGHGPVSLAAFTPSAPALIFDWASTAPDHPSFLAFLRLSPWHSYQQVDAALRSLRPHGTLLALSDLATADLDLRSAPRDILCPTNAHPPDFRKSPPVLPNPTVRLTHSLRAYLELLFLRPNFRLFLRRAVVRPRRLHSCLLHRTDYSYAPRARSQHHDPPKPASIRLGFDPDAGPAEFGVMIYCKGRLIRPYLKVGIQATPYTDIRVVGVVEADFLTPTPNMQTFEKDKLFQGLMFSLDRSLKAFLTLNRDPQKVRQLCEATPSVRWVMCDDCGKWRIVQQHDSVESADGITVKWVCAMNLGGTTTCHSPDDTGVKALMQSRLSPSSNQQVDASFLKSQRNNESDEDLAHGVRSSVTSPTFTHSPKAPSPLKRPRSTNMPLKLTEDEVRLPHSSNQTSVPPRFNDVWPSSLETPNGSPHACASPQGFMQDLNLELGAPNPDLQPAPISEPFSGADLVLTRGLGALPLQTDSSPNRIRLSTELHVDAIVPQAKARPLPYPGHMQATLRLHEEEAERFPKSANDATSLEKTSAMPLTSNTPMDIEVTGSHEVKQKRSPISGGMAMLADDVPFEKEPLSSRGEILKSSSSVSHEAASRKEGRCERPLSLAMSGNPRGKEMNVSQEAHRTRSQSKEALRDPERERPAQATGNRLVRNSEGLRAGTLQPTDDRSANGATSPHKKARHPPLLSDKLENVSMKSPSTRWRRRSSRHKSTNPIGPDIIATPHRQNEGPVSIVRTPIPVPSAPQASAINSYDITRGATVIPEHLRLSPLGDPVSDRGSQRSPQRAHAPTNGVTCSIKGSSRKPPTVLPVVSKKPSAAVLNSRNSVVHQVGGLGSLPDNNYVVEPIGVGTRIRKGLDSRDVDCADHGQREKSLVEKQKETEALALATEAAASAAKAVLGSLRNPKKQRNGEDILKSVQQSEMPWSHMALSAAVAAGAAAAAATTTAANHAQSRIPHAMNEMPVGTYSTAGEPSVSRKYPIALMKEVMEARIVKGKLQKLLTLLAPDANVKTPSWVDNIEELDVETVAREILSGVSQRQSNDLAREGERAMHRRSEAVGVSEQIACESLRKVRHLIHVFLDQVVGVLRTDDEDEPVENQLEEYLRVLDVLPM